MLTSSESGIGVTTRPAGSFEHPAEHGISWVVCCTGGCTTHCCGGEWERLGSCSSHMGREPVTGSQEVLGPDIYATSWN